MRDRLSTIGLVALVCLQAAAGGVYAYYELFSTFRPWDDEGTFMLWDHYLLRGAALYDDVSDPRHRRDMIDEQAIEASSLESRLAQAFDALAKAAFAGAERDLDPETVERFKKLGYVGGGK